ncbi:MAG: gamma-glutamylcyclotransferase [Pseudolabrys sp.]|nr:gamma-glutamylcyclotransferase [Pseudolabrys sp.]
MTLYFAYGSNLSRAGMQRRCPGAVPVGVAVLDNHRFIVGIDGWGSVVRSPGAYVHGVVWRITPRDRAALHAYELLDKGLYDVRMVPVRQKTEFGARRVSAMTYILRRQTPGIPKPGYVEMIAACARNWNFPEDYVRSIERWSKSRWTGSRLIEKLDSVTAVGG